MKIAAVQIRPIAGDVDGNVERHVELIEIAVREGANLVFFPELSITGYEPALAKSLATQMSNTDFDIFQKLSDMHCVTIGIGASLSAKDQVQIGMVWFQPKKPRTSYAKQLLHSDETSFFIPGDKQLILRLGDYRIAPAICYESLQFSHSDKAVSIGANVYLASVAKPAGGVLKAMQHYPETAKKHDMCIVMANCIGPCDNFTSVGNSAAWAANGELLALMKSASEGVLIYEIESDNAIVHEV